MAGFVIVCAIAVFAASMTIEANRNYFVDSVKYLTRNDTKLLIDNDSENERPSLEEEQVRQEIEETMGVEVPEFLYRPETFEFYDCFIRKEAGIANLQYLYKENIISVYIKTTNEGLQSSGLSIPGDNVDVIYPDKANIPISMMKIEEDNDLVPGYIAEWTYQNVYYQVIGKMPKKIFEKILKEMIF